MDLEDFYFPAGLIALIACVGLIGSCSQRINEQDDDAITKMVSEGVDPIKAGCAIRPATNSPVCAIASAAKN